MPDYIIPKLGQPSKPASPAPQVDPEEQYFRDQQSAQVRSTINAGPAPDTMATQTSVAKQIGVSPAQVEGIIPQAQTAIRANNMAAVAQAHPVVGSYLAQNPRQAVAAGDDHQSLGILGQAWEWLDGGGQRSPVGAVADLVGGAKSGDFDHSFISTATSGVATILRGIGGLADRVVGHYIIGLPDNTPDTTSGRPTAVGAAIGALPGIFDATSKSNAAQVQTHGITSKAGSLVGSVAPYAVASEFAPAAMGASGAGSQVEAAKTAGKYGTAVSDVGMLTNAGFQAVAGHAFGLLGTYAAPIVGDALGDVVASSAARATGGTIVGNYAVQAAGEGVARLGDMATRAVGSAMLGTAMQAGSNAIEQQTVNPNKSIGEGTGESALSMVALDLMMHGMHAAMDHATGDPADVQNKLAQTGHALLPDIASAVQGLSDAQVLDGVIKAGQDSTFRARDPDGYSALIKYLGDHHGVQDVYVPTEAIRAYQQSGSYDRYNDPFRGYADKIAEAEATGSDVALPTGFVLGDLAGSKALDAIKDSVKLRPEGVSGGDARAMLDKLDETARDTFDKINDADRAGQNEADARAGFIKQATEKFQNAGFTPQVSSTYAQIVAARAGARAERLGKTMQPGDFDTRIIRVLPPSLEAARKADNLDLAINAMRKAKPAEKQGGKSLLQFIADRGGMNDSGGDLKAMGADAWHREQPGRKNLIRDTTQPDMLTGGLSGEGDYGHDTTMRSVVEAGYFPELAGADPTQLDTNDLHSAISDELSGRPRYAEEAKVDPMRAAGDDLRRMIENEGRDPSGMSDKEVRQFVEDKAKEPMSGGRVFGQDDTPRGQIKMPPDGWGSGPATIELFQKANLSTLPHELGHQWLEELRFDAQHPDAPDQINGDWDAVQKWFKDNGHPVEEGTIPTDAHELFARGIERYLMEGKAPTKSMAPIFEKIRGWMVNIYKTVKALGSPITPEIRQVFDRLIATDDEIAAKQRDLSLQPAIVDTKALGMSDAESAAYAKLTQGARDEAQSELLAKTMETVRRQHTAAWNDERKGVRTDEAAWLEETPLFTALRLMKETPISKAWLVDRMGEDAPGLMPSGGSKPHVREGGAHPDDIAEMAGYSSGEEMIQSLMGAEHANRDAKASGDGRSLRARIIDHAADAEMARRHGDDPFNDGSIEDEAVSAVNNELAGKLLETELRILGRQSGNVAALYSIARSWARDKVRGGTITDEASAGAIQMHALAMAKAGREAEKAIIAGKYDEAFAAKQKQMISSALLREATDARDEVTKAQDAMAKIAKRKTMKSVDQDYLDQAHALLDDVQLGPRSQRSIDKQDKWAQWAEARRAEGYDPVAPDSFEATIKGTHWSRLPVDQFLGLKDAVDQVMHLGKLKQSLLDNQEEREWSAIRHEVKAGAAQMRQQGPKTIDQIHGAGVLENLKANIYSIDAAMKKMETIVDFMDGNDPNGVWNRVFFRPLADAEAREREMFSDFQGFLKDTFNAVPKEDAARWLDRVQTPWGHVQFEDGSVVDMATLTRQRAIAVALNRGNAGNLQRVADGYRINQDSITQFLNDTLTPGEWRFVQALWDKAETYFPELAAMEKRVNGIAPEKVEALTFSTPHAEMRGGYWPAIYDAKINARSADQEAMKSGLRNANYVNATTRASSTQARADSVRRPILLDLGVINRHFSEVIHDVTHREAIIQAWKFANDPAMHGAVKNTLGPERAAMLQPFVKQVANSWAMERVGNEAVGQWINAARSNMTVAALGFNAGTVAVHTTIGLFGVGEIGTRWMWHGLWATTQSPIDSVRRVIEMSPEVKAIGQHYDQSIRDMVSKFAYTGPIDKALSKTRELAVKARQFSMYGISFIVQRMSAMAWIGAHAKALSEGMDEADARAYADKIVRRGAGGHGAKDLPAMMNGQGRWGPAIKLLTAFYTPYSALYQRQSRLLHDLRGTDARNPRDLPELAARAFSMFIMSTVLSQTIRMGFGAQGPDKDESWAAWWAKKFIAEQAGPLPVAGSMVEPIWNKVAGHKTWNPSVTPLQRSMDSIVKVADDIGHGLKGHHVKEPVRDTLEAAGAATGLVPGQAARSAQFMVDVAQGSQHPGSLHDWAIGLQTGREPKAH